MHHTQQKMPLGDLDPDYRIGNCMSPHPTVQPSTPLITPLPVHHVHQVLPVPVPPQVLPYELKDPVSHKFRQPTYVRRDEHIGSIPKRVISRQRLWVRHIKSRAADELLLEGADESGLIDDLAACDVGDISSGRVGLVEKGELWGREEVGRFFPVMGGCLLECVESELEGVE